MDSVDLDYLLTKLRSGDSQQQVKVLRQTEKKHLIEAISDVVVLLYSLDPRVRGAAIEALGIIGNRYVEEIGPQLMYLLSDIDDSVRNQAAEALGMLVYAPAVDSLIHCLQTDPDELVRVCAAEALGYLDDPKAIPALLSVFDQEEEYDLVYAYAARSLGLLGNPNLIPVLRELLCKDFSVRVKAKLLLACIRLGDAGSISSFEQLMKSADDELSVTLANTLTFLLEYKPSAFVKEHEIELWNLVAELDRQIVRLGKIRDQKIRIETK